MYSKLTQEIRNATANSQLPTEFLVDLAAEHGEAVHATNERLTHVVGLLSQGYRDEAVQLAEQTPSLLELVAQLDIPEQEQWKELLSESLLEHPPALMMGAAEQLEQAYDELRNLEPLLKKNRLLALSQAPLQSRIYILQKLAAHDPTNPIWLDDSEMLQRARLSQIKTEYQRAKAKGQTTELLKLQNELKQCWDIPIPKSLRDQIQGTSTELAKSDARSKMQPIAARLNECLVEFDDTTARDLRDQWNELNTVACLPPQDNVLLSTEEAMRWLSELDDEAQDDQHFSTAVANLEAAVDQHAAIDQLDRKIYEAQKFERELPETLIHRVNSYRDGLQVNQRRKTWLNVAVGVAILAACITAIAWYINLRTTQSKVANARQQLNLFVAEDGFAPGRKFHEGLPEGFKNDGEIIRLFDQLVAAEQKENERKSKFSDLVKQTVLTGPLENNLDNLLSEARQIAVDDSEKNQIEILANRLNSERQIRQNKRNAAFLQKLTPHQKTLEKLLKEEVQANTIERIKDVKNNVEQLIFKSTPRVDGMPGISSSIRTTAKNLVNKSDSKIRQIDIWNQAIRDLNELKDSLDSPKRFASALQAFARRYPDEPSTQDFISSAKEKENWDSLSLWQALAIKLDSTKLESVTTSGAKELLEKINLANQSSLKQPKTSIQPLIDFLNQRVSLPENGQSYAGRLKTVFEQSLFRNIQVTSREGKLYYLALPFTPEHDETFKYFSKDASTRSTKKKETDQIITAPHCSISKSIATRLSVSAITNYEQLIVELIELTMGQDETGGSTQKVDSLIQCEFLDQILLFAIKTSPQLKKFAESQRARMLAKKLQGSDWKARVDANYDLRKTANLFIQNFKNDFDRVKQNVLNTKDDFSKMKKWTTIKDYSIVGFLYRTKSNWLVNTSEKVESGTKLYCLPPNTDGTPRLENVGVLNGSNFEHQTDSLLQAGRPVYVFSSKK